MFKFYQIKTSILNSKILLINPNQQIILLLLLIILCIFKSPIRKTVNYLNMHKKILYTTIFLIYITILITLIINEESTSKISNLIILFLVNILITNNIDMTIQKETLLKEIKDLKTYSKTNDLLVSNYRSKVHENQNQLIIIKSMIKGKKKDLEKYINNLLDEDEKVNNKWINDLKSVPLIGIKNFINYKLNEIEKTGAIIEIYISQELEKIISSKIDMYYINKFYTIIGVLLDNIIDASKESEEKLVSLNVYMQNNTTNIELANTFKNEIDIDKINDYGYTTKGENHGTGLYIVNKIIKNSKKFELETFINNKFFVQHLQIHHPKSHIKDNDL